VTPSQALQRVIVRMLYDPSLVARVYSGATPAPLTAAQADLLRRQPRGAWGTDPYRASRTLQALIEEYPAAASLTGAPPLHAFFRSDAFHDAIMARAVLADAFGAWVEPAAGPVARLERAVSALRRRRPVPLAAGQLRCATNLQPVSLPAGTLPAWQALSQALGPRPVEALVAAGYRPPPTPTLGAAIEHWILEAGPGGQIQLSSGSAGLNGLLEAASAPTPEHTLRAAARRLGADSDAEAQEIIDGVVDSGLLLRTSV